MPWTWNPKLLRYQDVDSGRIIARRDALTYVDEMVDRSTIVSDTLASMVGGDVALLSPGDWRLAMREELKGEYIRQYLLGIGGLEQMTPARWGSIGGMLQEQYRYLDKFTVEIEAGALSEAKIRQRAAMYVNSAREAYERANLLAQTEAGNTEVLWVLDPRCDHCPGCLEYADLGWQTVASDPFDGAFPGSGSTVCLCIISPESLVLTWRGWLPLLDVQVGDMVFTHMMRWRPVIGLIEKSSQPYHQAVKLTNPEGRSVWATHNHLWHTPQGWADSVYIDNSLFSLYNLPMEVIHEKDLSNVWGRFECTEQAGPMQTMSVGMCLRQAERSPGDKVCIVCNKRKGVESVAREAWIDCAGHTASRDFQAHEARGCRPERVASQIRRAPLELVLAGRREQKAHHLPLSVGMDYGPRTNTRRICDTPYQWRPYRRPSGKYGIDGKNRPRQTTRRDNDREFRPDNMEMPELWKGVSGLSSTGRKRRETTPEILFAGMLQPGTKVYDIVVEEDHSFVIEGFFAHNTNCCCSLEYK